MPWKAMQVAAVVLIISGALAIISGAFANAWAGCQDITRTESLCNSEKIFLCQCGSADPQLSRKPCASGCQSAAYSFNLDGCQKLAIAAKAHANCSKGGAGCNEVTSSLSLNFTKAPDCCIAAHTTICRRIGHNIKF